MTNNLSPIMTWKTAKLSSNLIFLVVLAIFIFAGVCCYLNYRKTDKYVNKWTGCTILLFLITIVVSGFAPILNAPFDHFNSHYDYLERYYTYEKDNNTMINAKNNINNPTDDSLDKKTTYEEKHGINENDQEAKQNQQSYAKYVKQHYHSHMKTYLHWKHINDREYSFLAKRNALTPERAHFHDYL